MHPSQHAWQSSRTVGRFHLSKFDLPHFCLYKKLCSKYNELNCNAPVVPAEGSVKTGFAVFSGISDGTSAAADADGSAKYDTPIAAKNELGENYGMVAWGGAIAEWNERAASFAAYVTGKTAEEVSGSAIIESTKPAEGTGPASSVAISIGGFADQIEKVMQ